MVTPCWQFYHYSLNILTKLDETRTFRFGLEENDVWKLFDRFFSNFNTFKCISSSCSQKNERLVFDPATIPNGNCLKYFGADGSRLRKFHTRTFGWFSRLKRSILTIETKSSDPTQNLPRREAQVVWLESEHSSRNQPKNKVTSTSPWAERRKILKSSDGLH